MITLSERQALKNPFLLGGIGYDCNGNIIKNNDIVEVVEEEPERANNPKYQFCGKGKKGKVVQNYMDLIIIVEFLDKDKPETVGCTDFFLCKIQ